MKYTRYKFEPEDNILKYKNLAAIAREVGCSTAMLCRVRQGTRSISEEMYQKIKEAIKTLDK